ncbi:MAG: hypothetical protein AB8F26_09055 [Phycisphaerales bacterium]
MFGLLIVVAVYAILGFMLAWIVGIVAKEEISVGQGVVILILSAIVNIVVGLLTDQYMTEPWMSLGLGVILNLGTIAVFTKLIAQIEWKESFIVAGVYAAILFCISLLFI